MQAAQVAVGMTWTEAVEEATVQAADAGKPFHHPDRPGLYFTPTSKCKTFLFDGNKVHLSTKFCAEVDPGVVDQGSSKSPSASKWE